MTKVLLVEDDKSLREIYGVRLLAEGYDIVSAGDGEAALAMAIKERPQLIVSDVMMPKISGFDMLDILRSTTETKDIKVIMMTALSSEDQRARGEALGADRYLVKSQVGIEDVVRTVHEVLGDAPTTASSARATFGGPAPVASSMPRPSAMPTPQRPASPVPPQQVPQPQGTQPTVTPIAPSAPSFQAPAPRPAAPAPSAGLPQPTAPFSTTRPASLGDRIIHPITTPAGQPPKPDLGSLMDQELNQASPQPIAPPPAPMAPPVAPIQQQVSPQPVQMPSMPSPAQEPTSPTAPAPEREDSGISFEETPRQPAPQSPQPAAQFTPGPQPPTPSSV
ncbi:MAG: response regulator [Candidatus Saccharibacteria bacterium]|nr:MAG: response regulator [Candidatus Saccharibacteria bacterium]